MNKNTCALLRYVLLVLILVFTFTSNSEADYWSDRRNAVIKGAQDPVGTVQNEAMRARDQIRTYLGQGLVPPIAREYITYLENQGNGRWKVLPDRLLRILAPIYVKSSLPQVRYAENINTIHNQGITVGHNIYFTTSINLNNREDMFWLLHELEHVSQYNVVGGIEAFLVKYLINGALEIGRNGSFNIHDAIGLERDADNKARRVLDQVWEAWASQPVQPVPQISRPSNPPPQQRQPQQGQMINRPSPPAPMANTCTTPYGSCSVGEPMSVGSQCFCATPQGNFQGIAQQRGLGAGCSTPAGTCPLAAPLFSGDPCYCPSRAGPIWGQVR